MHILSIDWDYFFYKEKYPHWENIRDLILNSPTIISAESHETILDYINPGDTVTNLDAHHDNGYHRSQQEIDCGNWTLFKPISYHLHYPEWRKIYPEFISPKIPFNYELPQPKSYDLVFTCKSAEYVPNKYHYLWENFLSTLATSTQPLTYK